MAHLKKYLNKTRFRICQSQMIRTHDGLPTKVSKRKNGIENFSIYNKMLIVKLRFRC